jgi:hypothetical protein
VEPCALADASGTISIVDSLNLSDVKSLSQVLERTPNGADVAKLADRLGLLSKQEGESDRSAFKHKVSELSPPQLSDEQGYWAGEFGRIVELIGLLQGQEKYLALKSKEARARERSRLRREAEDASVKKTAGQINDETEDAVSVRDVDEASIALVVLLSSATAAKEAVSMYLTTLSREISFRCSQMDARIY